MFWIVLAVTLAFAVLRFIVPVSGKINRADIFKDLAHIWVGFLMGLAVAWGEYWWLAGGVTAVELAAFAIRKK